MKKLFKKIVVSILIFESRLVLKKFKPKIIAITGSVGKTSTKDAIFAALFGSLSVRKSEKSYNSEIGVPLTILGLQNAWSNPFLWVLNFCKGFFVYFQKDYPAVLILEAGVGMPGDMATLTRFLHPDIVVLTHLAKVPVHVEYFGSPHALYEEKGKLIEALKPDGTFIVCGDDKRSLQMAKKTKARTISYGFTRDKNIMVGFDPEIAYESRLSGVEVPKGLAFRVDYNGVSFPVRITGTLGRGHIYAVLGGLLCAATLGQNLVDATKRLLAYETPPGRMRILEGIKNSTIIDDSYNSSPVALAALLESVKTIVTRGRKIAVFGDMLELGKFSSEEHRKAGMYTAKIFDRLLTVGQRARDIAIGALDAGMDEKKILQFENSREAGLYLQNEIREMDIVAVKGSQGSGQDAIRMERVVLEIMAHPDEAPQKLVRQEKSWSKR